MNSTKNRQIIDGIITGDQKILMSFYKKNFHYVKKHILQNKGTIEDAQDVFQDALLLIYRKLRSGEIEIQSSIHSYFIGICNNLWRNQLRKQQILGYKEILVEKIEDQTVSVIDTMSQEDQQNIYQKHKTKLCTNSRQLLGLFFEGKSMRNIAGITGYTEGYARKKKCIVKEKLIQMIQKDPVYQELVAC